MNKDNIAYITYDQALDLVERISKRAENFDHYMSEPEKESMSQLLSDIGVRVSDLIDVSYLADNYAINAELVTPEEAENYSRLDLEDALFSWKLDGETYYCIQW